MAAGVGVRLAAGGKLGCLPVAVGGVPQDLIEATVDGRESGWTPCLLRDVVRDRLPRAKPTIKLHVVSARVVLWASEYGFDLLAVVTRPWILAIGQEVNRVGLLAAQVAADQIARQVGAPPARSHVGLRPADGVTLVVLVLRLLGMSLARRGTHVLLIERNARLAVTGAIVDRGEQLIRMEDRAVTTAQDAGLRSGDNLHGVGQSA